MPAVVPARSRVPAAIAVQTEGVTAGSAGVFALRCQNCGTPMGGLSYAALGRTQKPLICDYCGASFAAEDGIWQALHGTRREHYARFMQEYERVRRAEGRGSDASDYYLALPFEDRSGRHGWQWSIRARTFRQIERRILGPAHAAAGRPLAILDLGAGNGWMSHRLARAGHQSFAIDLLTNRFDGLGAAEHFRGQLPALFPRFQAELDSLPFADEQFDVAIFNASFHYSENCSLTLAEAIRCLRRGGIVVVADSPYYNAEASGQTMVEERRRMFAERFGFASDALESCDYLTSDRLLALEAQHDLRWTFHRVWYGARWAVRPLVASLKGRREPSKFRIYSARVKTT